MLKTVKPIRLLAVILALLLCIGGMPLVANAENTYLDSEIVEDIESLEEEYAVDAAEVIEAIDSIEAANTSALTRASIAYVTNFAGLEAAIADPSVSIIVLLADIQMDYTLTINRDLTMLAVPSSVIIPSPTAYLTLGHFAIQGGDITLTFSNVTLDGGGSSGGIYSTADSLTLEEAVVQNCSAGTSIVHAVSGCLFLNGGEFSNNYSSAGSTIYCGGTIDIDGATVRNNTHADVGTIWGEFVIMNSGLISENRAEVGGGIFGDTVVMSGGVISNNEAGVGGGIHAGSLLMYGGVITGNFAVEGGGIDCGTITMSGGEISNNTADNGGGVFATRTMEVNGGAIKGNIANIAGGGIYGILERIFVGGDVIFSGNTASVGYNLTDPALIALHQTNILTTNFSAPFTQYAYNNYDISYTDGEPVSLHTVNFYVKQSDTTPYSTATVYTDQTLGATNIPADPQISGLVFVGWMDANHNMYDADSIITADVDLYACWMVA